MASADVSDGPIVVGTDGSQHAEDAVRWAAALASRRNRTLRVVHAFTTPPNIGTELSPGPDLYGVFADASQRMVADAGDVALKAAPDVRVEAVVLETNPIPALVEESRSASMLVLGSVGHGGFVGMLVGSTTVAVASHAECPVAVVRHREDGTPAPPDGPVVVGVDGSPISERAVAVAFREATLRDAPLIAVHAWWDVEYGSGFTPSWVSYPGGPQEEEQRRLLAERLAGWQEIHPDVTVERVMALDRPRHQLLERSRDASLVVVGSRGRGGFRGLLLGSTSQALIHHARCPVLVVRAARKEKA